MHMHMQCQVSLLETWPGDSEPNSNGGLDRLYTYLVGGLNPSQKYESQLG